MTDFCEPPMSTSTPQPSISRCVVPRPVMASTISRASLPVSFSSLATPGTQWRTPVEVSLDCMKTARVSGLSAALTSSSEKVPPYGALTTSTAQPKFLASADQRSPNLPADSTSTRSPGEVRFETEASIAPVPELDSRTTSFLVPTKSFNCARTRVYRARNSAVRWCMSAAAMANWAAGSSGVGPGVKRRVLRIMPYCSEDRLRQSPTISTKIKNEDKRYDDFRTDSGRDHPRHEGQG